MKKATYHAPDTNPENTGFTETDTSAAIRKNSDGSLTKHFPIIRTREEILQSVTQTSALNAMFIRWDPAYQEDFLARCSGKKGVNVLYDGIFKEIFNPEIIPQRLSELLSLLLNRNTQIKTVLPNDSVRLGSESSLLYTDIIVELEDGSLANIEIQKIGYAFPGERCACYSADHLLRQYKRVRGKRGEQFNYRDIKRVYTIVFFEKSPEIFKDFPQSRLHLFSQQSDTGLSMELLQEYLFIPLDIFRKSMENKTIDTLLEAWLAFLSFTSPTRIEELITRFPQFKTMYQDIYELCLNTEKVMNVYSKELEILDRNTVLYMIDEMQMQLDQKKAELAQLTQKFDQKNLELIQQQQLLEKNKQKLAQNRQELAQNKQELAQNKQELAQNKQELAQNKQELAQNKQKLAQQQQENQALKTQLAALQNIRQ